MKLDIIEKIDYSEIGLHSLKISETMSGKLLKQLSSNLYQKPHESAFREIAANMQDAFMNIDREFKADIEYVEKENKLIFRDYGIGMSHDTVINTFFTKGETVKGESADSLGGFGIGMLSICSISKVTTIHTYFDGYKNSYLLVDVSDTISYKHLGTFKEDGIGTEIILNLEIDKKKIIEYLEASLYFFKSINYINIKVRNIDNMPPLYEDDDIYIIKDRPDYNFRGHVLIGNTLYNYDLEQSDLICKYIYVKFKVNELEPSLNKEEVRLIPENIEIIKERFDKIYNKVIKELDNHYLNKDYMTFISNIHSPIPYTTIRNNFNNYLKDIVTKYFINDIIYFYPQYGNKREVTPMDVITNYKNNVYYCDSIMICGKRREYLHNQGIYNYYVVKGNKNMFGMPDYNDLPRISAISKKKSDTMTCTLIDNSKTTTIDYITDKIYYYALNKQEEKILNQALLLKDKYINKNNAISISTIKGKAIVKKYSNFIHAATINKYYPTISYEELFNSYLNCYYQDISSNTSKNYYLIKSILPEILTVFSRSYIIPYLDLLYCEKMLDKDIINKCQSDKNMLEYILDFIENHLYLKYVNPILLDNKIVETLKEEWNNYLDLKNL